MALAAVAALAGCETQSEQPASEDQGDATPAAEASPTQEPTETVSILRPEVEQTNVPVVVEPLETTIGFPEGGSELDEAAVEELQKVLSSMQYGRGGPILLSGHSDTAGSDRVNLRAGRERAEAVRDWLIEMGVAEDRIEVLTFGEQNPVEPNALPDGTPNEEGRAANRRVEILITPPAQPAA